VKVGSVGWEGLVVGFGGLSIGVGFLYIFLILVIMDRYLWVFLGLLIIKELGYRVFYNASA
jgi:hypothetical protein